MKLHIPFLLPCQDARLSDPGRQDGHEEEEEEEEESTINREEIVNAFCGPPCSVESLIHIIKRKNRQGRYVMEDEDYEMFERIDKSVRAWPAGFGDGICDGLLWSTDNEHGVVCFARSDHNIARMRIV